MQHVAHRASDARAHPILGRDIRNKIGQGLRTHFDRVSDLSMPPAMAIALDKLTSMDEGAPATPAAPARRCYIIDTPNGRRHVPVLGCYCPDCARAAFKRDEDSLRCGRTV